MIKSPIDLLLPHQRPVFDDAARWVLWLAGRQSGKSFTGAGWANQRCAEKENECVVIESPSERQSLEAGEKCKQWAEANHLAIVDEIEERDYPGALLKSNTIIFPNKSKIVMLPGKPETVRGFTGHLWMDEFGFFEKPAETWKASMPIISNQLKGKKRVLITSTPNGKSGRGKKLWELFTDKGKVEVEGLKQFMAGVWSCHQTTIIDAAPYLGTDVDELRRAIDDEEAWEQEFMCRFIDGSKVLLTYDAMALCEDVSCTVDPADVLANPFGEFYAGIDFGRTNDPTAMWIVEKMPQGWYRTAGVITMKNANTVDQVEALKPYIVKCQKVCVDYTGPGVGFGDMLAHDEEIGAAKTGEGLEIEKAELCQFSNAFKCDIFPKLKTAVDAKKILLPIDVDCREDLHEMQQIVNNGKYTYAARRTAEGHSDRCTALALAMRATTFEAMAAAQEPDEPVEDGYKYTRGW